MTYPPDHQAIVTALFQQGRFHRAGAPLFSDPAGARDLPDLLPGVLSDLELQVTAEYALLKSGQDDDRFSRAICILLAVMCYELEREGKNLLETLHSGTFSVADWEIPSSNPLSRKVMHATDHLRDGDQRRKF